MFLPSSFTKQNIIILCLIKNGKTCRLWHLFLIYYQPADYPSLNDREMDKKRKCCHKVFLVKKLKLNVTVSAVTKGKTGNQILKKKQKNLESSARFSCKLISSFLVNVLAVEAVVGLC